MWQFQQRAFFILFIYFSFARTHALPLHNALRRAWCTCSRFLQRRCTDRLFCVSIYILCYKRAYSMSVNVMNSDHRITCKHILYGAYEWKRDENMWHSARTDNFCEKLVIFPSIFSTVTCARKKIKSFDNVRLAFKHITNSMFKYDIVR